MSRPSTKTTRTPKRKSLADRLWAKVDRSGGPKACWPFLGYKRRRRNGRRGKIRGEGPASEQKHLSADRAALAISTDGDLDKTYVVGSGKNRRRMKYQCCHKCGNGDAPTYCVNPGHMYWGTKLQNEADKKRAKQTARTGVDV